MVKLDIKPLTVNKAYKVRRFKTDEYKAYKEEVLLKLRPMDIPDGYLQIYLNFGQSNRNTDFDNPVKLFVDCLQAKYDFNDNRIYKAVVEKTIVKKGEEFIEFELRALDD